MQTLVLSQRSARLWLLASAVILALLLFVFKTPVSAAMIGPMDDSLVSHTSGKPIQVFVGQIKYYIPVKEALQFWHPKAAKPPVLTTEQKKIWADPKAPKGKTTLPVGLYLVAIRKRDAQLFVVGRKGTVTLVKNLPSMVLKKKIPATKKLPTQRTPVQTQQPESPRTATTTSRVADPSSLPVFSAPITPPSSVATSTGARR